ncbi:antitoxin [Acidaminococcus fermentans]|uniref:antitoxin n=1 Tax=Acidaminococcus fermentans TaxID=905 RepID=UPI003F8B97B1
MIDKCKAGRPRGRKKISKIEVSIEPSVKEEFMTLLSNDGKTASGQICDWIREYIKQHKAEEV